MDLYDRIINYIHAFIPSEIGDCGACLEGDCDVGEPHHVPVAEGSACTCCGLIPGVHY